MLLYDTRCYFNVQSKGDISQLNLLYGTNNCLGVIPNYYRLFNQLKLYKAKIRKHIRGKVFEAFWLVNSMTSLNNFLRLG